MNYKMIGKIIFLILGVEAIFMITLAPTKVP